MLRAAGGGKDNTVVRCKALVQRGMNWGLRLTKFPLLSLSVVHDAGPST